MSNKFSEKDKELVIDFLNFISNKAEFNKINTREIIQYFKMLNKLQTEILPKIEANILEVKEVITKEE